MVAPLLALLALSGCGDDPAPEGSAAEEAPVVMAASASAPQNAEPRALDEAVGKPVAFRARDLVLLAQGVEIDVAYLLGSLKPVGDFVDLEAPDTFTVQVDALEIYIPEQILVSGMQGTDGPVKELTVRTEGSAFVLEGRARLLNLPFTFRADPMVTESGALALKLEKVRVLGIGVRGFLDAFEGPVEKAVNKRQRFLEVEKDLLIVDPFPFLGPPRVKADFTSVEVRKGGLVARLGEAPEPDEFPQGFSLVGGVFRSGGSMFFDSTVSLVARDGGPLVLDPERISEQTVAGFSKQVPEKRQVLLHLAPLAELK